MTQSPGVDLRIVHLEDRVFEWNGDTYVYSVCGKEGGSYHLVAGFTDDVAKVTCKSCRRFMPKEQWTELDHIMDGLRYHNTKKVPRIEGHWRRYHEQLAVRLDKWLTENPPCRLSLGAQESLLKRLYPERYREETCGRLHG